MAFLPSEARQASLETWRALNACDGKLIEARFWEAEAVIHS